ncbi:MAG: hypothetical protein JWM87_4719 [Candidatus Eremiobacteraeota bacterium]|nr:hypothetical protein [Candidatus Eremiobacteraeota bacterium]
MRARRTAFKFLLCLLALIPAACGGGGGGSSSSVLPAAAPAQPQGGTSAPAAVDVSIAIPSGTSASSSLRRARYVSAGTKSVAVAFGGARQTADCAATCSMTLQVQPGSVTFVASLYDRTGATGNVLASGQTTTTVVAGQRTAIKLVFGGVVAKLAVALAKNAVTAGSPATIPVSVTAQDAAGYTIVGNDPYATPIALSNDDSSGATSLSTTAVSDPSTAVTLAYNGSAGIATAKIGASVTGSAILAAPAALTVQPAPAAPPSAPPSADVPAHTTTWYYYGLNHVNEDVPAPYMAAHADYVEDGAYYPDHGDKFKAAGGKYLVSYTDPAYVPYCYAPFTPPIQNPCIGAIGNHVADESGWFHGADGGRLHRYVDQEFQYQEALNPASQAARDAWKWYTQRTLAHSPNVDFFLADDEGGTFIGPDGTQASGWFYGFNAGSVEITSDADFIAANQKMLAASLKPVFVNGYDPATRLPSYGGKWLDSPNVVGDEYEGCYTADAGGNVEGDKNDKWAETSNGILAVLAHNSKALCMMTAAATPSNRIYLMASWWMTYSEGSTIAAPERATPDGYTVRPEYDVVPRQPRATATNDIHVLRSSTGAYVREFAACYQARAPIGPCATIVNPSASAVAMPRLAGSYTRSLAVDDRSAYTGGQATWTGGVPAQLPALSAVVVR